MRMKSTPSILIIVSLALLSGCGGPGSFGGGSGGRGEPEPLLEGSWDGPAQLIHCSVGEICEQDRWANQNEFQVIVWNEDAQVSSSDPDVLEIVSVERGNPVDGFDWCFFNCSSAITEELSVIARTKSVGTAEFIIDGPAGDQRRLPVHVADIDTVGLAEILSDEPVDAIDPEYAYVRLDARDAEGKRLAVQGRWSIDDPDAVSLHPGLWIGGVDAAGTIERSTSALVVKEGSGAVSTTLRVTIGDIALAVPVEL